MRAVDLGAGGDRHGAGGEDQRELLRGQPEALLEDEGRRRDVGEQRRHREPAEQGQTHEHRIAQQRRRRTGRPAPTPPDRRSRAGSDSFSRKNASTSSTTPNSASATNMYRQDPSRRNWAPISGAMLGRHPDHQHQPGQRLADLDALEPVADDRHRQHHAGGRGETLDEPQRGQRLHRGDEDDAHRRHDVEHQPAQQPRRSRPGAKTSSPRSRVRTPRCSAGA